MIFSKTFKFSVAVIAACGLMLTSCVKPNGNVDDVFEVSLKSTSVGSGEGEQFVSVKCSGKWTLALVSDEGEVDWAELSVYSGVGNKNNVKLTYQVNAGETDRTLKVVLDNGLSCKECSMTQLAAGKHPEEDPEDDPGTGSGSSSPSGAEALASTGWLELPALDNPNLGYYSHNFKMNGKTYRNYSFGWSQKDRVALWVAYPLCKLYTNGNVGRTNEWALDPLLGNDSSAPLGGYGGRYDRGHQVPSNDRQCCYEANAQTFYGTNMTPQEPNLNQKGWQDLELMVHGWANTSDTTYVVTGCVVDGAKEFTTDTYGQRMTVPTAYFKALLKYSAASTLGQWNAIGFYYEHKPYIGSPTKNHSISIDELEKMTGLDFFVNLPSKIGAEQAAKIEAADPDNSSVWW